MGPKSHKCRPLILTQHWQKFFGPPNPLFWPPKMIFFFFGKIFEKIFSDFGRQKKSFGPERGGGGGYYYRPFLEIPIFAKGRRPKVTLPKSQKNFSKIFPKKKKIDFLGVLRGFGALKNFSRFLTHPLAPVKRAFLA